MGVEQKIALDNCELLSGNHTAAYAAKLSRVQVIAAYPITPQSSVVEKLASIVTEGELDAKFIPVESEHSAMSVVVAASAGGARTFTATSRQGLALMHEVVHWAGRGRCPIVMAVPTASIGPPPDIGVEQDDAMTTRDTGWLQFYCQSNQEIMDTIIQSYRIAEMVSLPVMVCYDGFIMSHVYEPVEVPDSTQVDAFLPPRQTKYKLDIENPLRFFASPGAVAGARYLSRLRRRTQEAHDIAKEVTKKVSQEFFEHFGRKYDLVETYRTEDAETVLLALTSVASIGHVVVDQMRAEGKKVGLVRVRLFRPFPVQEIIESLKGVSKVAVIDRNVSYGRSGVLAMEVKAAMYRSGERPSIYGFVAGLTGLSVTPDRIREAIEYTFTHPEPEDEIIWLGIDRWEEN
jgi:pyruvate/2-oxoacid:ferredoxin oxidoreductase alpha subunit